jgi:hypothetical protein
VKLPQAAAGDGAAPTPPHADPGEFGKAHPLLAEAFVSSSWSDGTPRRPARLSISPFNRRWYAQLDLVDIGLMVRVEIPDPLLAFDALEGVLSLENVPWEVNTWVKKKSDGKGKGK